MSTEPGLPTPEEIANAQETLGQLRASLGSILIGQEVLIEQVVVALLARGHVLLEGLPGLGKTELIKGLAALLGLDFGRVQFTPDLLPGDITGSPVMIEREGRRDLVFQKGPIFTHLLLADEINRASPKTQSALLEAMQESAVTVLGETHALPAPFFVLATQNPIELEGTYPLPEAQLDRFLLKLEVTMPGGDVLKKIIMTRPRGQAPRPDTQVTIETLQALFALTDRIHLPDAVADYACRLVMATHRENESEAAPSSVLLKHGASPRAAIALASAGRARALISGRPNVSFDDVQELAASAIGHRVVLDYAARADGLGGPAVVRRLLEEVPAVAETPAR
ncbi:MAG: AAA family ATPase [Planctomycetota bacterium]